MNDLEIIGQIVYGDYNSLEITEKEEIVAAAERMANRIAELEREVSNWKDDVSVTVQLLDEQYDVVEHLKKELAAAKSKNCGRCKWIKDCYKEVRLIGDTMDDFEGITFCSFFREAKSGSK